MSFLARKLKKFSWIFIFCASISLFIIAKFDFNSKENFVVKQFFPTQVIYQQDHRIRNSSTSNSRFITESARNTDQDPLQNLSARQQIESKRIIAYSFELFLEGQGAEISCKNKVSKPSKPTPVIRNRKWKQIENTDIYSYSAYYDSRLEQYHFVRIISMVKGLQIKTPLYCHIEENDKYHTITAMARSMWNMEWDKTETYTYTPMLISCKIPLHLRNTTINTISISKKPCKKPKFRRKIHKHKPVPNNEIRRNKNISFAICVKPLKFSKDISERLIAWIEMNKILGAEKIDFYIKSVHNETEKVLKYYEKLGLVNTYSVNSIGRESFRNLSYDLWQKRKYEVAFYNDCFYRNMNSTFVLPIDIDEIIFPKKVRTWQELISSLNGTVLQTFSSFSVKNTYFNTNISATNESIFILKYFNRTNFLPNLVSSKSFISTKNALIIFNHYAFAQIKPSLSGFYYFSKDTVQLNHYKNHCPIFSVPMCLEQLYNSSTIYDDIALKYKDKLKINVNNVIGLIKNG